MKLRVFKIELMNKNKGFFTEGTVFADTLVEAKTKAEKSFGYEYSLEDIVEVFGPYNYNIKDAIETASEEEARYGWYEDKFFGSHFVDNKESSRAWKSRAYIGMRYQYGGY